jgi:uncharacterized protein YxjI
MNIQYPLSINFKLLALAPRMQVRDATGRDIFFVSQKVLALKEDVRIFQDESKSRQLFQIKADRIIDFSAQYHITNSETNQAIGSVKHKGMRSIWKATYLVFNATGEQVYQINEDNPWAKVGDALFSELPILGMFSGYLFHPKYSVLDMSGNPVMRLDKEPSFFERSYKVHKLSDKLDNASEELILMSYMMMIQLERSRG